MGWRWRSLLALVALLGLGCMGPRQRGCTTVIVVDEPSPADVAPDPNVSWTILLYVDADCLDGAAILHAMNQFLMPRAGRVRVLALIDQPGPTGAGPNDLPTAFCSLDPWSEVRLLEFVGGDPQVLESWGEDGVPMNAPGTLQRFVQRGLELAPAPRVALWTFGHGHTWSGVCDDYSAPGSVLGFPAMAGAIQAGLSASGPAQLDLLIVNSCYAACLEALLPLSRTAQWIIASEKLTGAASIAGTEALRALEATPQMDGEQLGRLMVESYKSDDVPRCASDRSEYGCSLVRASAVPALGLALASFCRAARPLLTPSAGTTLTQVHEELLAARVLLGVPGPEAPPALIACCEAASCGRDPDDDAACQETDTGPMGSCCQADLRRLLEACLETGAINLRPSIQHALDVLADAVACRATEAAQETYGGVSIFFPCRQGDLDTYPEAVVGASTSPAGPIVEWREYARSLVAPGCAIPTQLTWLQSPGLVVPAAAPSTPIGLATDIEVTAQLGGTTAGLAAAWFSVREKASQKILLEIPLDRTSGAESGKLRYTWRGRSAAFLEGSPEPAVLQLAATYTTGHGLVLHADQVAVRWLIGEGESAAAMSVLAQAVLTIPESLELAAPGVLRDVRTFGRRGSVPTSLPAGIPVHTGLGSTTIVSDPPRVVWGSILRTVQLEIGFRCVDRLGGQIAAFAWWDTRKP